MPDNGIDGYKVVVVGNPNVGKSVIFGLLTGKLRYLTIRERP
ncbi:MAG: FeoB small GTPase domain-containing protein [Candidatus Jettenia sp. CY-1]|nr:MAG: FeoB small GTPase domain-containing protein [Candidatus Jettenia sp. CY-1]